jgi:hypothetical protein
MCLSSDFGEGSKVKNVFNIAQAHDTASHPGQSRRLLVIEEGCL